MMSMDRVAMALDDVIKADRKASKVKKASVKAAKKPIKKAAGGIKKKKTLKKSVQKQQPQTKNVVKKPVKKGLVQNGVHGNKAPHRRSVRRDAKPLGINQQSRAIVRRRPDVFDHRRPEQTVIREVSYVNGSVTRERLIFVEKAYRDNGTVYTLESRRRPARRI